MTSLIVLFQPSIVPRASNTTVLSCPSDSHPDGPKCLLGFTLWLFHWWCECMCNWLSIEASLGTLDRKHYIAPDEQVGQCHQCINGIVKHFECEVDYKNASPFKIYSFIYLHFTVQLVQQGPAVLNYFPNINCAIHPPH